MIHVLYIYKPTETCTQVLMVCRYLRFH